MSLELSYDLVWRIYQAENQNYELQQIPKTFYEDAAELIESLPSDAHDTGKRGTKENAIKLIEAVHERRSQKILMYVAFGRQLPQNAPQKEAELYDRIATIKKENRLNITKGKSQQDPFTLKSMRDMPEIVLPSGSRLGPLKKEQVVRVASPDDRRFLLESVICIEI
ncbi:MAG: hypothetical protein KGH98_03375 [Candidatus Micrarchaeota archaeon]|nr:hypothetical protein [Candidatus Micrarchaeota archaeon]